MVINPGNFDKKIAVIKFESRKDSDGFEKKSEVVVLLTWAQVTNISGTEVLRSNSDFSEVKTRFLMRTPKIKFDKDMVIKFDGNTYNIAYINDYGYNKKYTEIIADLVTK